MPLTGPELQEDIRQKGMELAGKLSEILIDTRQAELVEAIKMMGANTRESLVRAIEMAGK